MDEAFLTEMSNLSPPINDPPPSALKDAPPRKLGGASHFRGYGAAAGRRTSGRGVPFVKESKTVPLVKG